jgi:predicted RNA binding protein YcfA (HicA-like mRNA interferase family)
MTVYHNWWQIKKMLEKRGFKQTPDFSDRYLYYKNDQGVRVTVPKSDRIDLKIVHNILSIIELSYERFLSMYREDS